MCVLNEIQTSLVAPKSQYNSFGKYSYRSCEGILEALKPLLKLHKATLIITDEIQDVGGRVYVKATATLTAKDQSWQATAFAREPEERKGMDESQVTGAASSYARKYALNGLFAIDDTRDADATNTHNSTTPTGAVKMITEKQEADIDGLMSEVKANKEGFCKFFKINALSELPSSRYDEAIKMLENKRKKGAA